MAVSGVNGRRQIWISQFFSKTLNLFTVESNISFKLGAIQKKFKKNVDIGSYPFFRKGKIGVSIVLRSEDQNKIDICSTEIMKFVNEMQIEIVERD